MTELLRDFRDFFVSLKLTVVLLVLGMVLVFAATLDQVNLGIWAVQEKYFRSLFVLWRAGDIPIPVFPGGYLIGGMLLINLIAAHVYRFRLSWRKAGIVLTHFGLIILLIGELLTGLFQQEFHMRINEGETKNFAESYQRVELVITDTTDPLTDDVVAIPESRLADHEVVQHPKLPFRVATKAYFPNSTLTMKPSGANAPTLNDLASLATTGIGQRVLAAPERMTYKQDERNVPAAYVELTGPDGSLGVWMVSAQIPSPQTFEFGGRSWKITLRFARSYKPFSLTLLEFNHDVYPGTQIPKNFSSRVKLSTSDDQNGREVLIYMNNPLRYAGLTFYQSGYDGDRTTILQVVRNPSWLMPYIACVLMSVGLLAQFGLHLFAFIGKRRRAGAADPVAEAPASTP